MSAGLQLKCPSALSLEGNIAKNWKEFIRAYDLFSLASEIDAKDEKVQCATFLHVAGPQAQEIYATFTFPEAEKDKIEPLKKRFAEYCEPKKNVTVMRYTFNSRNQQLGERFHDYLTSLKTLVKDCEFGTLEEEMLRDRLVCGIFNNDVRMRLLHTNNLDLKTAVDTCLVAEMSSEQMKSFNTESSSEVNTLKSSKKYRKKPEKHCEFCPYEHSKHMCPAKGKSCNTCGKLNHFSPRCPNRNAQRNTQYVPQ